MLETVNTVVERNDIPEHRPTIKDMNRRQDYLIDENNYLIASIRSALVGPDASEHLVDVDRSTIEMNFRTNNSILSLTNATLHEIIDIMGIDVSSPFDAPQS